MIEKSAAFRLLIGLCIFVGAIFLLIWSFKISFYDMIKEILTAIVTGCAFSLPGAMFYIKVNSDRTKRQRQNLLEELEKVFTTEHVVDYGTGKPTSSFFTSANLSHIRNIYYNILQLTNENLVKNVNYYNQLRTHLENIIQAIESSVNKNPTTIDVNIQISACLNLIGKILKRNPYKLTRVER